VVAERWIARFVRNDGNAYLGDGYFDRSSRYKCGGRRRLRTAENKFCRSVRNGPPAAHTQGMERFTVSAPGFVVAVEETGIGAADPERVVAAAQALADIHRLFAGDNAALKIIAGLADGLTAGEICKTYEMAEREYNTTRKRMRRRLLRCEFVWSE